MEGGAGIAEVEKELVTETGDDLKVAGVAKVALDECHRVNVSNVLRENAWPVPGKFRVVVVPIVVSYAPRSERILSCL